MNIPSASFPVPVALRWALFGRPARSAWVRTSTPLVRGGGACRQALCDSGSMDVRRGGTVCVCVQSFRSMYKRPYSSREWHCFSMTTEWAETLQPKHTHTHGWGWWGVCWACLVGSAMRFCSESPPLSASCRPGREFNPFSGIEWTSPRSHGHIPRFYCTQWRKGPGFLYSAQLSSCVFLLSATSHTHRLICMAMVLSRRRVSRWRGRQCSCQQVYLSLKSFLKFYWLPFTFLFSPMRWHHLDADSEMLLKIIILTEKDARV